MKQVKLVKIFLNETYSRVHIDKNLSVAYPIQNGLKQGGIYHYCFSTLL